MAVETEQEVLPPVVELSDDEWSARFDRLARTHLSMSGEEFLRRLDAGEYADTVDDPFDHPWIGRLAQLSQSVR